MADSDNLLEQVFSALGAENRCGRRYVELDAENRRFLAELGQHRSEPQARPAAPPPTPPAAPAPEPPPEPTKPTPPDLASMGLDGLGAFVATCRRCRLCEGRTQTVFGAGNPEADLMFIGEGPGADEDRQGIPFVGAAGQLLTRIINAMQLTRDDVYIANIVKCRPPGNRNPDADEGAACLPYLRRQIELIQPRVLVLLGNVPMQFLLGRTGIMKARGNWYTYMGIDVMPTFHPAYLLRRREAPEEKRKVWEDMKQVMQKLGLDPSRSRKQR